MGRARWLAVVAVLGIVGVVSASRARSGRASLPPPKPAESVLLAQLVDEAPAWAPFEADSERGIPLFVGSKPRELVLQGAKKAQPELPARLKALGQSQLSALRDAMGLTSFEVEAWPYPHWQGQLNWAFARWRESSDKPWRWLDRATIRHRNSPARLEAELPALYRPWVSEEALALFQDFLERSDLYEKPLFGKAVWTTEDGSQVVAAWVPVERLEEYRAALTEKRYVARVLPPPARFNAEAVSFTLAVRGEEIVWPQSLRWSEEDSGTAEPLPLPAAVSAWPADFEEAYRRDLEILSGATVARFPKSAREARFRRKSSAQPDHQLDELVDYLAERYEALGLETRRHRFTWRGIAQSNLIAVIPGEAKGAENRPILLGDHIDTAFSEDVFERTGERETTPGADDNVTAVAALLRAAEVLKGGRFKHDIWIFHITGEEFPADSLGARRFVTKLLETRQDIGGLLVLDMIGFRKASDPIFQINAGESDESVRLTRVALAAAADLAPELAATYRSRFDPQSYLYNTDGIIFSHAGFPVVLFNEHLNGRKMDHPHYHQSSDVPANVDVPYAVAISRVAIETAARLARGL